MIHEAIPIEAKNAGTVHMLAGTIGTIYIDDGVRTADVDIDDYGVVDKIPIFYNCPESETATERNPFIEGDRALVVNSGDAVTLSVDDMKIVGFEDGLPRECGFQLKLTRGDGALITEASGLLGDINLRDSDWNWYTITTPVYNTATGYWSFNLANPGDGNPDGYLIWYNCIDGINVQYPYRYKSAEQGSVDDQIKPGVYEDIIPYWKIESTPFPDGNIDDIYKCQAYSGVSGLLTDSNKILLIGHEQSVSKSVIVYSSVPYKLTFHGIGKDGYGRWEGLHNGSSACATFDYCMGAYCYYDPGDGQQKKCDMKHNYRVTGDDLSYDNGAEWKEPYPPTCGIICESTNPDESSAKEYSANISGRTHTGTITNTFNEALNYVCTEGVGGPYHSLTGTPTYIYIHQGNNALRILAGYDY